MALATGEDVAKALRRPLTEAEKEWVPDALVEASALIIGHLGCDPTVRDTSVDPPTETVPDAARLVAARMVARLIEQQESQVGRNVPVGTSSYSTTTGPFGQTVHVQPGSNTGGPWLSAVDKTMLKPIRCDSKAYAVDTAPGTAGMHSPECSANFYRNAPYWQAFCTCGAYLAGVPTPGVG